MIKYEYELERDEQDVIRTYKPTNYPTEMPNLVFIEGPNDAGKSTLLNLVALSCHGLKNDYIKESLKKKIRNLVESAHQKIRFEVAITDKSGKPELFSEKKSLDSNEIVLRDGLGKIVTCERFEQKYRLIYDIPENPTERLPELLKDIKQMQLWFYLRVQSLRNYLLKIIGDIQEARDPERIRKVEQEIEEFEKKIGGSTRNIEAWEERLKEIKLFTYVKFHELYKVRGEQLRNHIKDLEKQGREKEKIIKKVTKEARDLRKQLADDIDFVEELYFEVTPLLESLFAKKEKNRFGIWRRIKVREEFLDPAVKNDLKYEGSYFSDLLDGLIAEESEESDVQKAQVYRELINLLRNYQNLEIEIPAAGVTISEFLEILSSELKKHESLLAKLESIKKVQQKLSTILAKRRYLVDQLIPKIKDLGEQEEASDAVEDDTHEYQIEQLEDRLSKWTEKIEFYENELLKIDVTKKDIPDLYASVILGSAVKELEQYGELELKEKIHGLAAQISEERKKATKNEANLRYLRDELAKLENKEPHKYHTYLEFLKETLKEVQRMENRINTYGVYIDQLIKKETKGGDDTKDRKEYCEQIFSYLGKRVGRIRYIDEEHEVTKIDTIKEEIHTKTNKIIKTSDMGTGRSQSAYLKGLLSAYDGRKIIALFDEVAMMDKQSLGPICEKIRELHNEGKLLLGIIVQRADKPRWKAI